MLGVLYVDTKCFQLRHNFCTHAKTDENVCCVFPPLEANIFFKNLLHVYHAFQILVTYMEISSKNLFLIYKK